MSKPTLSINSKDLLFNYGTLGMFELLTYISNSGLFDIKEHTDKIVTMRGERGTILYYNDKKVYLDFWEYGTPTWTGKIYDFKFDLIIKLQQTLLSKERLEAACQRKKVFTSFTPEQRWEFYQKIVPWTFFCSRILSKYVGKENELSELRKRPTEIFGFFCGKDWKTRRFMKQKLIEAGLEYIISEQELRNGRPLTDAQYVDKMLSSKFGIVLAGRGSFFSEAKNRREIDYMILRKPLLLNYKPYYYNPLEEGKHYIYITPQTNFNELEKKYDLDQIVKNATQWYEDNASPMGAAKTLLQILTQKLGG